MRQLPLGRTGPMVSAMGLGCMSINTTYDPSDENEALATLHRAVELGVTFFDTAEPCGLGANERVVGRGLAASRDDVTIATKVGFAHTHDGRTALVDGRPVVDGRPEHIVKAIDGSLTRLATDRIDLVYLHRTDPTVPIEHTVTAMADLVQAGKVRHLGLCEASAATIRRAHAVQPITAVQTEYSLFDRSAERNGVLSAVRELGIGFVPCSPLGQGLLTGPFPRQHLNATVVGTFDPLPQDDTLTANKRVIATIGRVAAAKGVAASQLAIAWTMADGAVPIPGTRHLRHLEENLAAADVSLTAEELAALDAAAPIGAAADECHSPESMALLTR
ncbi:aldo/keto reductase [Catellatospora citrea]|uniref:Oxidoreductase n=1 Tax=Catellatospora citrea TaxID=53366 RepID=A0A8J3P081_9ACTN|nr:aldo/keto reductase [Catellatospora citrea]RKE10437.1 aryl-alcohol dehydrogenase-like predicted oxidoreductase [Catellatospora citrea]GIF99057.1 oxidoreductase [Catellatospora citrea]